MKSNKIKVKKERKMRTSYHKEGMKGERKRNKRTRARKREKGIERKESTGVSGFPW